jgi:hypothetical protein
VRESANLINDRVDDLEAEIKLAIGDTEGIAGPGFKVTWKKNRDSTKTNWEAVARGLKSLVTETQWETIVGIQTSAREGARVFLPKWGKE